MTNVSVPIRLLNLAMAFLLGLGMTAYALWLMLLVTWNIGLETFGVKPLGLFDNDRAYLVDGLLFYFNWPGAGKEWQFFINRLGEYNLYESFEIHLSYAVIVSGIAGIFAWHLVYRGLNAIHQRKMMYLTKQPAPPPVKKVIALLDSPKVVPRKVSRKAANPNFITDADQITVIIPPPPPRLPHSDVSKFASNPAEMEQMEQLGQEKPEEKKPYMRRTKPLLPPQLWQNKMVDQKQTVQRVKYGDVLLARIKESAKVDVSLAERNNNVETWVDNTKNTVPTETVLNQEKNFNNWLQSVLDSTPDDSFSLISDEPTPSPRPSIAPPPAGPVELGKSDLEFRLIKAKTKAELLQLEGLSMSLELKQVESLYIQGEISETEYDEKLAALMFRKQI